MNQMALKLALIGSYSIPVSCNHHGHHHQMALKHVLIESCNIVVPCNGQSSNHKMASKNVLQHSCWVFQCNGQLLGLSMHCNGQLSLSTLTAAVH